MILITLAIITHEATVIAMMMMMMLMMMMVDRYVTTYMNVQYSTQLLPSGNQRTCKLLQSNTLAMIAV